MADADIFGLGFSVDTASLLSGKAAAEALAKSLVDVAKAMQAEEAAAKKAAAEEAKKAAETKKAADEAARAANPHLRLADAMGRIGQNAQGMSAQISAMTQGIMQAGQSIGQGGTGGMLGAMQGMLSAGTGMLPMLGGMAAGLGAVAAGVGGLAVAYAGLIVSTADQQEKFMLLEARLKNVYQSSMIAGQVFEELTGLANKNGLAIEMAADSYLRLARNNEAIGLTRDQMLELTDAVQMLGTVSNASQGEMQGALMQFSQALAAGRLNGDELRSIMESMPALTKAIADGLGVSVGQIRAMGAAGELTSDKITGAILTQLPKIREEFEGMPDTSSKAFARVGNEWDSLVARMGEALNASQILTGFGNILAGMIEGANDALTPETPEQAYARIMESRAKGLGNNGALSLFGGPFGGIGAGATQYQDDAELQTVLDQLEAKRKLEMLARQREEAARPRADYLRTEGVVKEIDDTAKKTGEIKGNLKALEAAYASFQARPELFEPGEVERLRKYPDYIAALRTQLSNSLPVIDDYQAKTARMMDALDRFGAGGAASLADEAFGLVNSAAGKAQNLSMAEAEAAVVERRTVQVETQTRAMEAQIAEQGRLKDAIGGGTQAQIDAEVATKAYNLQLQLFGTDIGPEAESTMDRYAEQLRKLLTAQREVTDAQRLYNTEVKLGIEAQITAAIRAGATAGEIAALRRQLELGQELSGAGGNFPSSLITTESGGNIRALNSEGYGGRLQFGDARLADAARAGIIPQMTGAEFSKQPLAVQQSVEDWHFSDIDQQAAARGLLKYIGQEIAGVTITQNGIRAMAHLGGIGGAQSFLESGGATDPADSNGTNLSDYARIHGGSLTVAEQAAMAEERLAQEQSTQSVAQRVAEIERQTAAILAGAGAGPTEAVRLRRDQEVESATASAETPEQRAEIEAAMRRKFAAEDEAARAKAISDEEQLTALKRQEAEIAKLPAREREIERRVLEKIIALKEQGVELDKAGVDAIREQITQQLEIDSDTGKSGRQKFEEAWNATAQAIGSALDGAIRTAVMSGKVDAESVLKGLVADITSAIFSAYITKPLVEGITGLIGAQGLVMGDTGPTMFLATGGIVDRPTRTRGALIGEAGPEAVLPLRRGTDGRLGVGAAGGGGTPVTVVINDMRSGNAAPVESEESTGPDGERIISMTVRDEVRGQIASGTYDKQMRAAYGSQRPTTRR